jgi:hypothetical protein
MVAKWKQMISDEADKEVAAAIANAPQAPIQPSEQKAAADIPEVAFASQ